MKHKNKNGKTQIFIEEITMDEKEGLLEAFVLDNEGKRTGDVHINKLHQKGDTFWFEYYNIDSNSIKTPLMGGKAFYNRCKC